MNWLKLLKNTLIYGLIIKKNKITPSIHNFIKLYNNKISKFEEKKVVIDVRKKSEKLIAKKVNGKSRSLNLIILTKSDPIPS